MFSHPTRSYGVKRLLSLSTVHPSWKLSDCRCFCLGCPHLRKGHSNFHHPASQLCHSETCVSHHSNQVFLCRKVVNPTLRHRRLTIAIPWCGGRYTALPFRRSFRQLKIFSRKFGKVIDSCFCLCGSVCWYRFACCILCSFFCMPSGFSVRPAFRTEIKVSCQHCLVTWKLVRLDHGCFAG